VGWETMEAKMDYGSILFVVLGVAVLLLILSQTELIVTIITNIRSKKKPEDGSDEDSDESHPRWWKKVWSSLTKKFRSLTKIMGGKKKSVGNMTLTIVVHLMIVSLLGTIVYFFNFGENLNENVIAVLMIITGYTILSIRVSKIDQVAALVFLGKPLYELNPGPHLVPFGLFTMPVEIRTVIQRELPGEPEKVWYGEGDTPDGKVDPLRIPTAESTKKSTDPLENRMTLEPALVLRFRIKTQGNNNFIKFIQTVGTVDEAVKQLTDTSVRAVSEEYASRTPKLIIAELAKIQRVLKLRSEILVGDRCGHETDEEDEKGNKKICSKTTSGKDCCEDSNHETSWRPAWGIDVLEVSVKVVGLSHTVNKAMRDVPAAGYRKKMTITDAEAEQIRLTKEGLGVAAANHAKEKGTLTGRAEGLQEMMSRLKIDPDEPMSLVQIETLREALENSQHTIIAGSSGISDLLGMVVAAQETLKRKSRSDAENVEGEGSDT
jgi:regulator of protease activity HflC (stomatin/prohibitin superfamily)